MFGGQVFEKVTLPQLERVHRRAARLISGTKLADNVSHELLLARVGLSPLAEHRQYRLPSLPQSWCTVLYLSTC